MSKHFCFCIPVRFGVFLFSFISFALSALSAALGWFLLHLIDTNQLSRLETNVKDDDKAAFEASLHKYKWAVIVGSIIFTFVALVAFFGFVGSIIRNRRMVKAYSVLTILSFFLGSFASGFVLYATWSHKPFCVTVDNVKSCTESNLSTGGKIGFTVGIVFQWLIQLYIVTIIRRYYQQLEEEREYRNDFRLNPTTGGTYEAKEGLLATQGAYPYSDNQHRFGSNA
ncbi:hypothetical protein TRAPUB_2068 [Trametes pubescens]|uniref:Uncharacterized protein n=1 Tax=Trametes pubescens TaxID=154538 RepID=A0A1M2VHG9_TRAPU|nr:hypothetical protein TRAPUB_2068 [Trametes pubescens]